MFSFRIALLALLFIASIAARADAAPPTSLDVSARHVGFFSERYVVTADGDVKLRLSDGTIVRADTFSMDLKLNRYLMAGNVRLQSPRATYTGAAFAGFLDFDRSYFLPADGTPDRWTFFGTDWVQTHAGREQPGDAFYFPELPDRKPYITARTVTIVPKTNATFGQAGVRTLGAYVPTPRYVVTFSSNSHFAENAFFGARFDIAEPYNASAHSLSALHLRNDAVNGTYVAFDQHFVWDGKNGLPGDWIVASIDPLTQRHRQYNVIGYKRLSPKMELRTFYQLSEGQPGGPIQRPIDAASYLNLQMSAALKRSGLSLNVDQYNNSLLGIVDVQHDLLYFPQELEHPMDLSLSWTGYENRIGRAPLLFRLRSGGGYAHDQFGEGGYPNLQPGPRNLLYKYAGGALYTSNLKLGKFGITAKFDKQRTWYSLPHHLDITDVGASVARQAGKFNSFVSYDNVTTADFWGAQQLQAFPPAANVQTTPFGTYTGFAAFRGLGTARNVTTGLLFTPSQYASLNLQLSRHWDTPAPVPGLYGQPPWQLTSDLRVRISRQVGLDLTRQYYFNFANNRWSPQWGILFTP